jgi:hypothetical protein
MPSCTGCNETVWERVWYDTHSERIRKLVKASAQMAQYVSITTATGKPIAASETTILPHAKVFALMLPGDIGGLVWSRPVAVQIADDQGQQIPIRDTTRMLEFLVFVVGLLLAFILPRVFRRLFYE